MHFWDLLNFVLFAKDTLWTFCRVIVSLLQVQEPPTFSESPMDARGVELGKVELKCAAMGSPKPHYTWLDWEGIDATQRHGKVRMT